MAFDWNVYSGNLTWLESRTIYMTVHGSRAYGTNLPTSDTDLRGVCIAPKSYYHGFSQVFEQATCKEPDFTVFEIRKFFRLAGECNPNALEIIFTDPSHHLIETPAARMLLDNRRLFLSRKVRHTFQGYAHAQMKRILTHRRWLLNPAETPPTRGEFGLPERTVIPADQLMAAQSAIRKQLDRWSFKDLEHLDPALRQEMMDRFENTLVQVVGWSWSDQEEKLWASAAKSLGLSTNFIELLDKERRYTGRMRDFHQYTEWKDKRNPARAELEAKYGFDSKHAMHLVRLARCCEEILIEGDVHVRREDAEELLSIRAGAWSFEKLVEWFEAQSKRIEEVEKISPLPSSANVHALDKLCADIVESML